MPIDHLVVGAADLVAASAEFGARTGVTPAPGGRHPDFGTHNALVSLGDGAYLELLAPDPEGGSLRGLGELLVGVGASRLVTFAVSVDDADAVAAAAEAAGLEASIADGARETLGGRRLAWRNLVLGGHPYGPLVPFFIEWAAGSAHPSATSPAGCRLLKLEAGHPDATALTGLLAALGLDVSVSRSTGPHLTAVIDTPRGHVVLD